MVPLAAPMPPACATAAQLRGPGAAPVGRAALARRLVAGSLDRAVDVAATLELRGYGSGSSPRAAAAATAPATTAALLAAAAAIAAASRSPARPPAPAASTPIPPIELDTDAGDARPRGA